MAQVAGKRTGALPASGTVGQLLSRPGDRRFHLSAPFSVGPTQKRALAMRRRNKKTHTFDLLNLLLVCVPPLHSRGFPKLFSAVISLVAEAVLFLRFLLNLFTS